MRAYTEAPWGASDEEVDARSSRGRTAPSGRRHRQHATVESPTPPPSPSSRPSRPACAPRRRAGPTSDVGAKLLVFERFLARITRELGDGVRAGVVWRVVWTPGGDGLRPSEFAGGRPYGARERVLI
jgi:hypothetical protein